MAQASSCHLSLYTAAESLFGESYEAGSGLNVLAEGSAYNIKLTSDINV